jgi:hypothetical protein
VQAEFAAISSSWTKAPGRPLAAAARAGGCTCAGCYKKTLREGSAVHVVAVVADGFFIGGRAFLGHERRLAQEQLRDETPSKSRLYERRRRLLLLLRTRQGQQLRARDIHEEEEEEDLRRAHRTPIVYRRLLRFCYKNTLTKVQCSRNGVGNSESPKRAKAVQKLQQQGSKHPI